MQLSIHADEVRYIESLSLSGLLKKNTQPLSQIDVFFRLNQELQTTLELESLLTIFFRLCQEQVNLSGLAYHHPQTGLEINIGTKSQHAHIKHLFLSNESLSLGSVKIFRNKSFSTDSLNFLDQISDILNYPIRNALLYQKALLSASTDPLTGVHNRASFDTVVQREIELSRRHDTPLSIVCADIDWFKKVNDQYGHLAGDEVIKSVANIIKQCARSTDFVFRYGGEEFVMLLTNAQLAGAKLLAKRIRHQVSELSLYWNSEPINVTLSLGAHCLSENDNEKTFFSRADDALYQAKNAGRNCVKVAR